MSSTGPIAQPRRDNRQPSGHATFEKACLGTPFSTAIDLVERFTPSADGSRLDYRLAIADPGTATAPFEVERFWIWRPEIVVSPYECGEAQSLEAVTRD